MLIEPTIIALLTVCSGLLLILIQAIKLRQINATVAEQGKMILNFTEEVHALMQCEKGMGNRIKQQQQVKTMLERQDKLEISDVSNTSYKQAMVLLQKGASTDELINACDLSRGELDLLSRMKIASKAGHKASSRAV
jgi:hypothetical protein